MNPLPKTDVMVRISETRGSPLWPLFKRLSTYLSISSGYSIGEYLRPEPKAEKKSEFLQR